jgi:hypothetical protein
MHSLNSGVQAVPLPQDFEEDETCHIRGNYLDWYRRRKSPIKALFDMKNFVRGSVVKTRIVSLVQL